MKPGQFAQIPQYPDLAKTDRPDLDPPGLDDMVLPCMVVALVLFILAGCTFKKLGITRQACVALLGLSLCASVVVLALAALFLLLR